MIDPNIAHWQPIIHQWAVKKGWWDRGVPEDPEERARLQAARLDLVRTELDESWEAYQTHYAMVFFYTEEGHDKPDGAAVELADAVIRIMDLDPGFDLSKGLFPTDEPVSENTYEQHLLRLHWRLGKVAEAIRRGNACDLEIRNFIAQARSTVMFMTRCDILWTLVEVKHRYNEVRPYRHGGKLVG